MTGSWLKGFFGSRPDRGHCSPYSICGRTRPQGSTGERGLYESGTAVQAAAACCAGCSCMLRATLCVLLGRMYGTATNYIRLSQQRADGRQPLAQSGP